MTKAPHLLIVVALLEKGRGRRKGMEMEDSVGGVTSTNQEQKHPSVWVTPPQLHERQPGCVHGGVSGLM